MATDSGLFHRLYLIGSAYQHERCDFAEQLRQGQNGPAFVFEKSISCGAKIISKIKVYCY
jgi:hypothetical protein